MHLVTLYHNPRCSKSREALAILQTIPCELTVIDYLKTPLTLEQLKKLRAHFLLADFVRSNEPIFKERNLSLEDEEQLLKTMVNESSLMQRPIVIVDNQAIIARPATKIAVLFS